MAHLLQGGFAPECAGIVLIPKPHVWKIDPRFVLNGMIENSVLGSLDDDEPKDSGWVNRSIRCSSAEGGAGIKFLTTSLSFLVLCWKLGDVVIMKCVHRDNHYGTPRGFGLRCCIRTFTLILGFIVWVPIFVVYIEGDSLSTCHLQKLLSQISIGLTTMELLAIFVGWYRPEFNPHPSEREEEIGAVVGGTGSFMGETTETSTYQKIVEWKDYYILIRDGFVAIIDFADTTIDAIRITEHNCAGFGGNVALWILSTLIVNAVSVLLYSYNVESES